MQLLIEDAEFVTNAVTDRRHLERCQRIEVAGGEAPQSPVAEPRLLLQCQQRIEILIERSAKMLSPMSMVLFFHLHGAAARVDKDATAFGLRDDQWDYDVISQWHDPTETGDHIRWTRDFWTAVEPFASGEVYVNHLDAEEATRIRAAYSRNYDRLVALKNKYDPANLFHMNQNIRPTG